MRSKLETRITAYLSHRPKLYALIVGIGIVLFWRGVWHGTDEIMYYLSQDYTFSSISTLISPTWWDAPLTFLVSIIILYFTGAFTSSFIGNELILSGLRGEKRLNEKTEEGVERTEEQVKNEVRAIADIRDDLKKVTITLGQLERKVLEHHSKN